MMYPRNIWQFQIMLSQRLLRWAGISIGLGLLMRFGGSFWRGVGSQFAGWGLVNALIAFGGRVMAQERAAGYDNPGVPEVLNKESNSLQRLLWINAGLDVLYMLGGGWLIRRDKGDGRRKGMGLGVIIQGAFLFVFDIVHALMLPRR